MTKTISASLGALMLAAGLAGTAAAQITPAPADDIIEVTVTGQMPEVIDKIDRRTYDITNDPEAVSGIITDILRKLPSVTVSTDNQVALRGAGVTVLIDGKVPPEGNAAVKSLPSVDVARVEIMTNPSAQYAPDGTGGIINIITRRHHALKLSGDLNVQGNSRGQGNAALSANLNTGRWSLGSQVFVDHYQDRNISWFSQAVPDDTGGFNISDREDHTHSSADNANGTLSAGYKLTERGTLTVKGEYGNYDSATEGVSTYLGADPFDEQSFLKTGSEHSDIQALYDFVGGANGEYLSLLAERSQYANTTASTYDRGEGDLYRSRFDNAGVTDRLQGDYERRFGQNRLSTGFSVERTFNRVTSGFDSMGTAFLLADYDYIFAGHQTLSAAYATWQMPLGKWTILPGLRVELRQLQLTSETPSDDLSWYPSLHLSRDLDDTSRLKLSYSKRVFRPSLSDYDPTVRYYGANNAGAGNPDLEDQTTDSYEAGYSYAHKDFGLDATLYYRDTRGNFSPYEDVTPTGLLLMTTVNAGRSQSGGVELTTRGGLSKHLTYSVNSNLFYARIPYVGGRIRNQASWSGNALLGYDADNGDQYQVNATGSGKTLTLQGYTQGFYRVDVSYQHPLNDKLSLVVSVTDLLNSSRFSTVVDTPELKTRTSGPPNLRAIKIALAYKFGGAH